MSDQFEITNCPGNPAALPARHPRLVPNIIIATILLGSALSLFRQRDYWPFSNYPMFAEHQAPAMTIFDIVGVPAGDSAEEIPLAPARRTAIIAGGRHQETLTRLVHGDVGDLHRYLENAARRYAESRQPGVAALRAVRLYRSRWEAAPQQSPPARRIERQLLAEIELTGQRRNGK